VWEGKIAAFIAQQAEPDVSVAEVLEECLQIEPGRWQRSDQMRVARCLTHLQLKRYQKRAGASRAGAKREWRYRVSPTPAAVTNLDAEVGDTKGR
jgi:hypothetical protein